MAFTKQGGFSKEPNDLPDVPSSFYSPEEIKSFWQTPINELKETLNQLIDDLQAVTGAENIGATANNGLTGGTIQELIDELKQAIDDTVMGQIPDNSLTQEKADDGFFIQGSEKLWDGPPAYPNAQQTITPSKKLSECRNGWILVWSDYDYSVGPNDFHWVFTYIPKAAASLPGSGGHLVSLPTAHGMASDVIVVKSYYLTDSTLTGTAENDSPDNNSRDVCLRYVYEW